MNQPSNSTSTLVVVPAYNEATIIRSALEGLLQLNLSVVVVDDGSAEMPLKSSWTYFSEGYRDDLDPVYSQDC